MSGGARITGGARLDPAPLELEPTRFAGRPARFSRMDRLCALAVSAADSALLDAGVDPARFAGAAGERIAVAVGTAFGCHATNEAYYRGLCAEGARAASPRLFAYTLPSSPVGEITIHCGARGPAECYASGRSAGLEAVVRAARWCESGAVSLAIAVAVDTGSDLLASLGHPTHAAAAAVILEPGGAQRRSGRGSVGSFASAFVGRAPTLAAARARALAAPGGAALGNPPFELAVRDGDDAVGPVSALVDWLRDPARRPARLVAADPEGAALALHLDPEAP